MTAKNGFPDSLPPQRLLLVTATAFEIQPTLAALGCTERWTHGVGAAGSLISTPACDVLVSGVGQLQSAVHITRAISTAHYNVVVQAGLAGSFSDEYPKGSVVTVAEQVLADFGAESESGFIDIVDMGLLPADQPPFSGAMLRNPHEELLSRVNLASVRSATVNRTLSDPRSIGWVSGRYAPDIVNMEGAALFYSCLAHNVPFIELRAISDMVGPRNKAAWDIPGAIRVLNSHVERVLDALTACSSAISE